MGDAILKKITLIIAVFLMQNILIADTSNTSLGINESVDVSEYDRWFNEINDVRVGVNESNINALLNPFTTVHVASTSNNATPSIKLELNGILDGKSAMINNSWYKLNSRVYNMRLSSIKKNSVVLSGAERTIELYLRKTNENSIIKTY